MPVRARLARGTRAGPSLFDSLCLCAALPRPG
eukprot:COSAG04_NODE_1972_length_5105_cov_1.690571_1_plen_31_part_10